MSKAAYPYNNELEISVPVINFAVGPYLFDRNHNAHNLVTQARLSTNTVYPIVHNRAQRIDKLTLGRLLMALRELTGEPTSIADLFKEE